MDCEACTDRLVDLLYEELGETDTARARAHLAECERCAAAFERMSAGRELATFMVLEEPPKNALHAVMRAAEERARGNAPAREDAIEPSARAVHPSTGPREPSDDRDEGGLWAAFIRWLGGFAMGPQVAMAVMLLLMVGIGLFYLPELRRGDPTDAQAIVDPSTHDEAAPSSGLVPAEPLDLEADPRTARIRNRAESDEVAIDRTGARDREESDEEGAPEEVWVASERVVRRAELERNEDVQEEEGADALAVLSDPIESPESAMEVERDLAPGETLRAPAPQPPPMALQQQIPSRPSAPAVFDEQPTPPSEEAPPRVQTSIPAQPPVSSTDERYRRGMQRFEARDYRGAANDFESVIQRPDTDARRLLPSALHHLARSHARAGECVRAIAPYEQLLSRYRAYSGAADAMIEVAECYRRTGQLSRARAWLEEASRNERVASRAQRELVRLEAMERGHDRNTGIEMPAQVSPSSD
jgi:TolA-binding protein